MPPADNPDTELVSQHDEDEDHPIANWFKRHRLKVIIGSITTALATGIFMTHRQRKKGSKSSISSLDHSSGDGDGGVRIPLKEVLRFKERQWFLEELETSRDGDANSMLRLAKMYLHGQGCAQNVVQAQEWLRKARQLGVYSSLEELWAGEPDELNKLKSAAGYRVPPARRPPAVGPLTAAG